MMLLIVSCDTFVFYTHHLPYDKNDAITQLLYENMQYLLCGWHDDKVTQNFAYWRASFVRRK